MITNSETLPNTSAGWSFDRAETGAFIDALGKCLGTYWDFRDSFRGIQRRCMDQDLSWDNAAESYEHALVDAKYQW